MSLPMNSTDTTERTCGRHGSYTANHLFGQHYTSCPSCDAERAERDRQRLEEMALEEIADRKRAFLRESGIAGRYLDATFDSFKATTREQRLMLRTCREFADKFNREQGGLWLVGPPGVGKTHLGAAIARAVIEQHARGAKVASAREIVRQLRDTWKRDAQETEADVIAEFGRVSLLVLDEVGAGFGTEGEQVQLFDVIDKRYTLKLPTVLLSNLNAPLLRTALGDRSFDRLREGAKVLVCNWPSHRGASESTGARP